MANKNFKARIGIEAPLIAADNGTTAITLSDNDVTVVGDLTVTSNTIKSSSATAITMSGADVSIAGDITITGNDIKSSSATAITMSGADIAVAGDLTVSGDDIRGSAGLVAISISGQDVGITGDLTVAGNDIKSNGGTTAITMSGENVTVAGNALADNFVKGVIRNSTVEANGDVWGFLSGTGTGFRGISIDNSTNTAKGPLEVIRGYTGGASAPGPTTPRLTFERARGTSASPTAIQSGDLIGQLVATGANGAGTFIGDAVAAQPASLQFLAAESFSSTTNVGTQMTVSLMPTGKTLASVATPTTVFGITPQSSTMRSDSFTWQTGNTSAVPGSTTIMTLDVNGNLVVTGDLRVNGNDIQASDGATNITLNSNTLTTFAGNATANGNLTTLGTATFNNELAVNAVSELLNTNTASGTSLAIQTNYRPSSGSATYSLPQAGWQLGNFRFNSYNTTGGAYALAAQVSASATENWTGSANGSNINFFATKAGTTYTTGLIAVISASPETMSLRSDVITLESSGGTDYMVLNNSKILNNRPHRNVITTATTTEGSTYSPAATDNNSISLTINTGSGTTVINLANLTGQGDGGMYTIMVFNNAASGTPIQVKNTRINTNNLMTHTIPTGDRIMITAYIVGDYATAEHLVVA